MATRVKHGGRKKGTPNKISGALKEMILGALDECGGQAYFVQQAKDNPVAFMTLIGKVLPSELSASVVTENVTVSPTRIEIVGVGVPILTGRKYTLTYIERASNPRNLIYVSHRFTKKP